MTNFVTQITIGAVTLAIVLTCCYLWVEQAAVPNELIGTMTFLVGGFSSNLANKLKRPT